MLIACSSVFPTTENDLIVIQKQKKRERNCEVFVFLNQMWKGESMSRSKE